jgi:methyl acetate hydrolase
MGDEAAAQARVDRALNRAVEAREVPGVVAMAATDTGLLYQGAFGTREIGAGPAMTPDTLFRIASMTKAVTSVAAMQLVEAGALSLDGPVPAIDPALASPQVLDGFDSAGSPLLRPARRPITLRHLLTHTAGFSYDTWDANTQRYVETAGLPSRATGRLAALRQPLVFDPGERWEYGIATDWVGRIVEVVSSEKLDAYFREHILAPLGLADTTFLPSPAQRARQASVHQRQAGGSLEPQPLEEPVVLEVYAGGGGLYSTAPDYLRFLQMLLHEGKLDGARILRPETVALMNRNQIGELSATTMKTQQPGRSNDVDLVALFGADPKWGLGYLINTAPGLNGRSPNSLSWAGLFNSYYWVDPAKRVAGVIMTQILPFADPLALSLYGEFERGIYAMRDRG